MVGHEALVGRGRSRGRSGRGRGFWAQKLLGVLLLLGSFQYLFDPNWPISGVRLRTSSFDAMAPSLQGLSASRQAGTPVRWQFFWVSSLPNARWYLVLLDAAGHELAWSPPLTQTGYRPSGELLELLEEGRARAWRVVGRTAREVLSSPLQPLPGR